MNDHVVNGAKLKDFVQKQYNFTVEIYRLSYVNESCDKHIEELKKQYQDICKDFKITIDYN